MQEYMNASVLILAISWLLAGIFAMALKHKVGAWPRFIASLTAYDIVPERLVKLAGALLVVSELAAVLLLFSGQPLGLWFATLLLSVYAMAIAINVLRGKWHIDCGCGDEPTPVSWFLFWRNTLLVMMAQFGLVLHATGLTWTLLVALIALGLSLIALGIYVAVEQLMANRGRHQRLWLGAV